MSNALEIENLNVKLNSNLVLEDIDLKVKKNDFMAIIGPNGGGKSTLLKTILGLIQPESGKIKILGKGQKEALKFTGYLPQKSYFDLAFPINVFDVVLMARYNGMFKRYKKEDKEAVFKALETVGMRGFKDKEISELSGGEMQRVFIARALAREPQLLLLDEPTASVDPGMQKSFYKLLSSLKKKMTIVLVTHDVGVASSYVDSIACLNQRLFYHGTPDGSAVGIEAAYNCPVEIIGHGIPHRVFKEH